MPDIEKVVKGLESLKKRLYNDKNILDGGIVGNALALLKAKEPVEPLRINHDTKWQRDTECICGECGGSFYRLKVNFCPWCGKAVRWE